MLEAFLVLPGTEVHHTLEVADTVDLGRVHRAEAFAQNRLPIIGWPAISIHATRCALVFSGSVARLARVMALLAEFLRSPDRSRLFDLEGELRALALVATVLEQLIHSHALQAFLWQLGAAL